MTLVGVVSADFGLGLADFRAAERTFQLLTQVAGRAGRGAQAGEAIIQTLHPDHYSIRLATRQDYDGFYTRGTALPPGDGLSAGGRADQRRDPRPQLTRRRCRTPPDLGARLQHGARGGFAVLGPAPAPLAKLRGEYRAQIFLKTRHRTATRVAAARALDALPELARRVTVDVDPMGML